MASQLGVYIAATTLALAMYLAHKISWCYVLKNKWLFVAALSGWECSS